MALINIQRFRDVLVRTKVAEDAPAMEVSVGLEQELAESLQDYATLANLEGLRSDFELLRAEMRQLFAEQEAKHQQQLNRLAAIMLTGATFIAAVTGILVAVFG